MSVGIHFSHPMKWYLEQLTWAPPGEHHRGTSNIELALDFEASTRVPLIPAGEPGVRTLRQKAVTFVEAARRTAELARGRGKPIPGVSDKHSQALQALRLPQVSGWECRADLLKEGPVKQLLFHMRN